MDARTNKKIAVRLVSMISSKINNEQWLFTEYIINHKMLIEISKECGCSVDTVRRVPEGKYHTSGGYSVVYGNRSDIIHVISDINEIQRTQMNARLAELLNKDKERCSEPKH
jgi:hypothetical protein